MKVWRRNDMGKLDPRVPAYVLNQTGVEIQEAINNMQRLSGGRIDELITLLQEIKAFDSGDDNETIGQQLLNLFKNKADKETVETLRDIINTHKTASELDHNNESVKERHIANGAITDSKIANDAVSSEKISNGAVNEQKIDNAVMNMIRNAVAKADWDDFKSEVTDDVDEIRERLANNGGVWHYGNALTHTENASVQTDIVGATRGDFYLNIEHFYVYYTKNGEDWDYIGNLKGSIDASVWAGLHSPNFTGIPTAPSPATTNNSNQIATTEYVRDAIDAFSGSDSQSGTTGVKTFKLSECQKWQGYDGLYMPPDVVIGQTFLLKNDIDDSLTYFTQNDEDIMNLSEPILAGETRVCLITDFGSRGADHSNGYLWVFPNKK